MDHVQWQQKIKTLEKCRKDCRVYLNPPHDLTNLKVTISTFASELQKLADSPAFSLTQFQHLQLEAYLLHLKHILIDALQLEVTAAFDEVPSERTPLLSMTNCVVRPIGFWKAIPSPLQGLIADACQCKIPLGSVL